MIVTAVLLASGLGAVARFGLAGAVQRRVARPRPWGTAVVNITGALLLGIAVGLHASGRLADDPFVVVGVGFFGGFTTFSTWMVESVLLGEDGAGAGIVAVAGNVVPVLVAGILGAAAGIQFGTQL